VDFLLLRDKLNLRRHRKQKKGVRKEEGF